MPLEIRKCALMNIKSALFLFPVPCSFLNLGRNSALKIKANMIRSTNTHKLNKYNSDIEFSEDFLDLKTKDVIFDSVHIDSCCPIIVKKAHQCIKTHIYFLMYKTFEKVC